MYLDMPEEAQFPELLTSVNEASGANLLSMAEVQAIEVPAGHKSVRSRSMEQAIKLQLRLARVCSRLWIVL